MHVNSNGRGHQDYKMVVVGHRAVGKSALVVRFLTNRFISEYQENSEMTCNGMVEVDGEKMQLKIQDTSEKGIRIPTFDHHFRSADAIMLVYSITDKMSYQRLRNATSRLKQKLMQHELSDDKFEKIPALVVIGNKGDLNHMRQVEIEEGKKLSDELGCPFYETSASEGWSRKYSLKARKNSEVTLSNGETNIQRPKSLWSTDKTSNVRRKSDPALRLNSIFGTKIISSPENDMNNNDSKNTLSVPTPTIPQISISPSEEVGLPAERPSIGMKLMQKLSPRLSRKFGGDSKSQNTNKMSNIGAGLARMGATAGLAVGGLGRGSNTLPVRNNLDRKPVGVRSPTTYRNTVRSDKAQKGMHTLHADGTWSSSFSDSSCSSSSSESLVPVTENNIRATFFLRPETPVSDAAISSSEEDDFVVISKSAHAATSSRKELRRSRPVIRGLNMEELRSERLCNSDSDSTKSKLSAGTFHKRGHSETRAGSLQTESPVFEYFSTNQEKASEFKEKSFNASEPFKNLCREARTARRMRDRITPTKLFRKFKISFASDQAHHNNYHYKNPQFQVTAVGR